MSEPRTADRLLVFAPNWLGDAVMALPALALIRRARPAPTIDIAARSSIAPLFSLAPGFGHIVVLGDGATGVGSIREGQYDAALLLTNSFHSAWMVWRAGVGKRWGYRRDFRSPLLTRAVTPPVRLHQRDYYCHLVRQLGFDGPALQPQLDASPDQRAAGAALLSAAGWDGRTPLVAVAPGAAFGGAKRWPASSFAAVITHLAKEGSRTVLIGVPADRSAVDAVKAAVRPLRSDGVPIDLVGRTDLPTLAGVLVHSRALVTNDSGAMHVAAALGVNVTAMFGPTRERETHPLGTGRHAVLTHAVWCRPCMLRECPLTHACMAGISPDAVLAATKAMV